MKAFQTDFQIQTFLYIFYTGFFVCAIHGLVTPLFGKKHFVLALLLDLFLTVLTAFFLFLSIFYSGSNSLRFYMLIAFLLGGTIWQLGPARLFKNIHLKRKSAGSGE